MSGNTPTPVTIIGLGAMGAAMAQAYLDAGHPTTVWNRTAEKAAPLVARGASHVSAVEAAVAASPLVIACLSTYEATLAALEPANGALAGRTLITLNTGTPVGARTMADWATGHGARFLDGAIKDVPTAVGKPQTLLYFGGDKAIFDEYEATLQVLGGHTVHLGDDVDLAALYEIAVGGTLLPALLGFFQGAALVTARGLSAESLVPYTVKWLQMVCSVLPVIAEEIDTADYTKLGSSVSVFHDGIANDHEIGEEGIVDVSWHAPMHELLRRAVAEGHRDHSISSLIEVLRKPQQSA
ncbi:NAD(P)-binding domain-containing protein [Streptomyces sp. NPDC003077]|uniref:NAD(P)-dependent oxidoreductase n=1 Tax=Streptomyces sp. NPDC003077 TaxID=3154443 RepID=UPI0033BA4A1D